MIQVVQYHDPHIQSIAEELQAGLVLDIDLKAIKTEDVIALIKTEVLHQLESVCGEDRSNPVKEKYYKVLYEISAIHFNLADEQGKVIWEGNREEKSNRIELIESELDTIRYAEENLNSYSVEKLLEHINALEDSLNKAVIELQGRVESQLQIANKVLGEIAESLASYGQLFKENKQLMSSEVKEFYQIAKELEEIGKRFSKSAQ